MPRFGPNLPTVENPLRACPNMGKYKDTGKTWSWILENDRSWAEWYLTNIAGIPAKVKELLYAVLYPSLTEVPVRSDVAYVPSVLRLPGAQWYCQTAEAIPPSPSLSEVPYPARYSLEEPWDEVTLLWNAELDWSNRDRQGGTSSLTDPPF